MTSAEPGRVTTRPCSRGPYHPSNPKGDFESGSEGMVSQHPFPIFIADSAKVLSEKRCAKSDSAPISCEDFDSPQFCYTTSWSFDWAIKWKLIFGYYTYLFFEFLVLSMHLFDIFFHFHELSLLLEPALLSRFTVLNKPKDLKLINDFKIKNGILNLISKKISFRFRISKWLGNQKVF